MVQRLWKKTMNVCEYECQTGQGMEYKKKDVVLTPKSVKCFL